jgi:RND family efflux transporter MFP subunit
MFERHDAPPEDSGTPASHRTIGVAFVVFVTLMAFVAVGDWRAVSPASAEHLDEPAAHAERRAALPAPPQTRNQDAGRESTPSDPPAPGPNAVVVSGLTAPADQASLATVHPGRIASFDATEGAAVRAGDAILHLDEKVQATRVAIAQLAADSRTAIDLAEVRLRAAEINHDRLAGISENAAPKELSDARLELDAARLNVQMAELQHAEAVQNHRLQSDLLSQLTVRAPFDGFVTEYLKEVGEVVEEREPVVMLVRLDELTVSLDCPMSLAVELRTGGRVTVTPSDARFKPRTGFINYISKVADAGSQSCRVRVRVDNRNHDWLAGMKVEVAFDPGDGVPIASVAPTESKKKPAMRHGARRARNSD